MNFFKRLFQKEKPKKFPAMPPWVEIVKMMYDKSLDAFVDEVVRVVYSADNTMRYVVLKDEKKDFLHINWKPFINSTRMNGSIFAQIMLRCRQCGNLSEVLLGNRFLKTKKNC